MQHVYRLTQQSNNPDYAVDIVHDNDGYHWVALGRIATFQPALDNSRHGPFTTREQATQAGLEWLRTK